VLQGHGRGLLGHPLLLDQLDKLIVAAGRARQADPVGWPGNAHVKLLASLRELMLDDGKDSVHEFTQARP
jgi:toxin YhaV